MAASEQPLEPLDEWRGLPDHERLALVELVNRVLDKGVVVTGEVTISIGGVDLLFLGLQIVLSSVQSLERAEGLNLSGISPRGRSTR